MKFISFRNAQSLPPYQENRFLFFKHLCRRISEDYLFTGAAAMAYYFTLSIFPALIFLIGLLPYLSIPNLSIEINNLLLQFLPGGAAKLLETTVSQIVNEKHFRLLSFGALLTLWTANSGVSGVVQELNFIYRVKEKRSFAKRSRLVLFVTLGFGALIMISFLLILLGQNLHGWMSQNSFLPAIFFESLRWLIIIFTVLLALSSLYFYGPDAKNEFVLISPGTTTATFLFIGTSLVFKSYVDHVANYNAMYGSLGAVISLMVWFDLLGIIILLGAHIDSMLETTRASNKIRG